MADFRFDTDTAGTVCDDGSVAVSLHAGWNVDGRILNGGYLQAVALAAVTARWPQAGDPVAVSTSFVAAAAPGPATVTIDLLRAGAAITAVSASIRQQGATVLTSLVSLGDIDRAGSSGDRQPGDRQPGAAAGAPHPVMPRVTGPAGGIRLPPEQLPGPPGLAALIDYAFVPEASGWLRGDFSGGPRISCWLSFQDGRAVDVPAATAFMDIAPPVCFALGRFGWAPTLQLQTALFAAPAPGPVLLELHGDPYDGPVVAEDARLWDSAGTLIAQSRQIALAPRS